MKKYIPLLEAKNQVISKLYNFIPDTDLRNKLIKSFLIVDEKQKDWKEFKQFILDYNAKVVKKKTAQERELDSAIVKEWINKFKELTSKRRDVLKDTLKEGKDYYKYFDKIAKVPVIIPLNYRASIAYGCSTWCIVQKEEEFNEYFEDSTTFYLQFPKNTVAIRAADEAAYYRSGDWKVLEVRDKNNMAIEGFDKYDTFQAIEWLEKVVEYKGH